MPHLRLALAGALLLAVPALSSCGFDYPTERVNTVGSGVTDREAEVDVVGSMIVAGQPDRGTLIGTLSNNSDGEIGLTALSGGEKGALEAASFEPFEVPADGYVNLATLVEDDEAITVTGEFEAGDFVSITFEFDNGDSVAIEIPVMKPCYQFEGLDVSEAEGGESASEDPLYTCEAPEDTEAPAEH